MIARVALLAGVFALAGLAEESRLGGPVPGFVFHGPTHSIRPIVGVPGAAYLGAPVARDFDAASISPLGKSALAVRGGQLFFVKGLESGAAVETPVDGGLTGVDRMAWSLDGLSAAVYASASRQAQILRSPEAGQAPAVETGVDLSGTETAVSALAFDGKRLIVGAGGIYLGDGSGVQLLTRAANPAAFALGGRDLYAADSERSQIWLIREYAGEATPMLFADDRAGVSSPSGLRLSGNGRNLVIANPGASSVDALEIATRAPVRHLDLEFKPTRMDTIGSGALALLNQGTGGEPLYIIDSGEDLAVYFVPARSED
jgi:hypothetical protein